MLTWVSNLSLGAPSARGALSTLSSHRANCPVTSPGPLACLVACPPLPRLANRRGNSAVHDPGLGPSDCLERAQLLCSLVAPRGCFPSRTAPRSSSGQEFSSGRSSYVESGRLASQPEQEWLHPSSGSSRRAPRSRGWSSRTALRLARPSPKPWLQGRPRTGTAKGASSLGPESCGLARNILRRPIVP